MVGKYEGDKKGASAGQPQPKQLTNSRRGNTPTNEQNQGQFKARPAPTGQNVKESSQIQNQKQTKTQQNQAKQAQKTAQKNVKNTKTQAKKSG